MAQDVAFLRLLQRNHKQKSALQQQLEQKKQPPVQVDPYMLKELLEGIKTETENNGGQAPQIQQRQLADFVQQEILSQMKTGRTGADSPCLSSVGSQHNYESSQRRSNFSIYLRQQLEGQQSDIDLNFDGESAIHGSLRGKIYSASESEIFDNQDGEGGGQDYDLDEIVNQLAKEEVERLKEIMQSESNRDPGAVQSAMLEALAGASQAGANIMFQRGHAPSGFDIESIHEDVLNAMYEVRSNVAGVKGNDGSDDDYVQASEYEMDIDAEDFEKIREQYAFNNEDNLPSQD